MSKKMSEILDEIANRTAADDTPELALQDRKNMAGILRDVILQLSSTKVWAPKQQPAKVTPK